MEPPAAGGSGSEGGGRESDMVRLKGPDADGPVLQRRGGTQLGADGGCRAETKKTPCLARRASRHKLGVAGGRGGGRPLRAVRAGTELMVDPRNRRRGWHSTRRPASTPPLNPPRRWAFLEELWYKPVVSTREPTGARGEGGKN